MRWWFDFLFCLCVAALGTNGIIVPDEIPTALSVIYSNIPKIQLGTDSRIGWGFRFGDRADAQILLELGPQQHTQRLANQQPFDNPNYPELTSSSDSDYDYGDETPGEDTVRSEDKDVVVEEREDDRAEATVIGVELETMDNLKNKVLDEMKDVTNSSDINVKEKEVMKELVETLEEKIEDENKHLQKILAITETNDFKTREESDKEELTGIIEKLKKYVEKNSNNQEKNLNDISGIETDTLKRLIQKLEEISDFDSKKLNKEQEISKVETTQITEISQNENSRNSSNNILPNTKLDEQKFTVSANVTDDRYDSSPTKFENKSRTETDKEIETTNHTEEMTINKTNNNKEEMNKNSNSQFVIETYNLNKTDEDKNVVDNQVLNLNTSDTNNSEILFTKEENKRNVSTITKDLEIAPESDLDLPIQNLKKKLNEMVHSKSDDEIFLKYMRILKFLEEEQQKSDNFEEIKHFRLSKNVEYNKGVSSKAYKTLSALWWNISYVEITKSIENLNKTTQLKTVQNTTIKIHREKNFKISGTDETEENQLNISKSLDDVTITNKTELDNMKRKEDKKEYNEKYNLENEYSNEQRKLDRTYDSFKYSENSVEKSMEDEYRMTMFSMNKADKDFGLKNMQKTNSPQYVPNNRKFENIERKNKRYSKPIILNKKTMDEYRKNNNKISEINKKRYSVTKNTTQYYKKPQNNFKITNVLSSWTKSSQNAPIGSLKYLGGKMVSHFSKMVEDARKLNEMKNKTKKRKK